MFEPIYTERLMLREFIETDITEVHEYLSDPEVLHYMMHDITTFEGSKGYLKQFLKFQKETPRIFLRFAVVLTENNSLIGECGINMPNYQHKEGELVFRLNKKYWGKGYATEAAGKIVEFGFRQLNLHRIEAICDDRNVNSSRVLEKIGMEKEGCLREHRWIKGRWRSSLIYSILDGSS